MTEWRSIAGYEGHYEVSSDGEVRSLPRVAQRAGRPQTVPGRMLKLCHGKGRNIYPAVYLQKPGEKKRRLTVHRLVAIAFLGAPPNGTHVNHKNGDKTDNHSGNLEWCTLAENAKHAAISGLVKSTLTAEAVVSIKAELKHYTRGMLRRLGARYGVTPEAISAIRSGKNWGHVEAPTT